MADALWLADFLGVMAEEGTSSFYRQSLVGFHYGLLDTETLAPRPSAMALILLRRFVHRARLSTTVDRRPARREKMGGGRRGRDHAGDDRTWSGQPRARRRC
ncbi:MAG TPA: hypothetical protein RMH99_26285 [Sandaracinaceae bacterium LLY-WYZ-13_1]|nr:hypothetical protein [Sandaracinaceae bacterium LLY-WYZ-13_1]